MPVGFGGKLIWKTWPWPQDWKRSVFIPVSKKDNAKWMHNCTHLTRYQSNAQKFPSKSSPVHEPWNSRCQVGFRKGRGTRDQITNMRWIIEKAREFQKSICFCSIDYAKAFDCVDHNKLWKILQEMEISDHLTCLLRNLYVGQKATVRTRHIEAHFP